MYSLDGLLGLLVGRSRFFRYVMDFGDLVASPIASVGPLVRLDLIILSFQTKLKCVECAKVLQFGPTKPLVRHAHIQKKAQNDSL